MSLELASRYNPSKANDLGKKLGFCVAIFNTLECPIYIRNVVLNQAELLRERSDIHNVASVPPQVSLQEITKFLQ